MPNNRVLLAFALAAGIVLYCSYQTLIPREITFAERLIPVAGRR